MKKPSGKRPKESTTSKGRAFEALAASFYRDPGINIKTNVRFAPKVDSDKRHQKREIDLLIEEEVVGKKILIPIECKDEKGKIGSPKIDSFVGTLNYIGIPSQHGIYISSNGYTRGAIERASEAGISPFILKTNEYKKNIEVNQSLIYLLPVFQSAHLVNEISCKIEYNQGISF